MKRVTTLLTCGTAVISLLISSSIFASSPPITPISPITVITPEINEAVVATVSVDPRLSKSALANDMKNRLRPNRGLTHYIPTSTYVKSGDFLRVTSVDGRNVQICINVLSTPKLCDQRSVINGSNDVYIQSTYDGEVYIDNQLSSTDPVVEVTVTGGREMPIFRLGEHTDSDFLAMLESATSPNIHLVSPFMVITGPIEKFKSYGVTNPTELMQAWEQIIAWGEEHYGFSRDLAEHHQPMKHKVLFLDVGENGYGLMYATTHHLGTGTANAFNPVVNTNKLLTDGGWGPWHEYGHTLQPRYLQFNKMTEVTTNITSQKVRASLGYGSRLETRWQSSIFPYLDQPNSGKDYFNDDLGPFERLGLFWQLDLTFGPRFYQRMSVIMRNGYNTVERNFDGNSDHRVQVFIREASLATGYDLRAFFADWGVPTNSANNELLGGLSGYLKPSTNMSNNSDFEIEKKDHDFGRDVAIHYRPRSQTIQISYDYYRTWQPKHRAKVYVNGRFIGKISNNQSDRFNVKISPDTAITHATLNKRLRQGDRVKVVFDTPQTDLVVYNYRFNDLRIWANSEKERVVVRVSKKRFNGDNFSLIAYSNGSLIFSCQNQVCDQAGVRVKNNKVVISKGYQLEPDQPIHLIIGHGKGYSDRVIYAK
ncbi:M60 family metallopeptidase [Photobacterium lucens]|uniref:M60 family metallopeptidase n=1 Tax=Photobacterium lucens TaxID=2562949 RepID=UPI001370E858|nr:M60 family metallopeptidase [Photobacterium lucens]MZG56716.1 hypothetical protein [Photobacterium lucens]MZG81699.1 hypothetical protein [Photobacterium lucens]